MVDEARAEGGPAAPPPGLSENWPVPWEPVWGPRDGKLARLECAVVRLGLRGAAALPDPLLNGLLAALGRIAPLVDRRHAKAARGFLRQALGDMPHAELEGRVRGAFRHLLRVVIDAERLARRVPVERLLEHYDMRWSDEARKVIESGVGCILLTAHLGNWEAALAAAPWVGFDPVYVISKPPANRPLSIDAQQRRERQGARLIPRRGAMAQAPAILRAGGTVAMMLDQRARKRPVLAPLFGRPARCDRGAAVLLKRLRAPVIVAACYMADEPLHYRAEFFDVIHPEEVAGATLVDVVTRINRSIETMILKAPDQYFWLHDRYRDTPLEYPPDGTSGDAPSSMPAAGEATQDGLPTAGTVSSTTTSPSGGGEDHC